MPLCNGTQGISNNEGDGAFIPFVTGISIYGRQHILFFIYEYTITHKMGKLLAYHSSYALQQIINFSITLGWKKNLHHTGRLLVLILVASAIISGTAHGTDKTWIGAGTTGGSGTDFNTATNWSPSGVPGASDDIIISLTEAGTISLSATTTINSLNFTSTIATGVLDLNDKILTGSSGFTLGGSAYIKLNGGYGGYNSSSNNFPVSFSSYSFSLASTVDYYGGSQLSSLNYGNLVINNSYLGLLNDLSISGNLIINSGKELDIQNKNATIGGNVINNGIITVPNAGVVTLNGTNDQIIGGTTSTTFKNLTIDKTSGKIILHTDISVVNTLLLTQGIIDARTNDKSITVGVGYGNGTITGARSSSYINGKLTRNFYAYNQDVNTFPVGHTSYHPVSISANTKTEPDILLTVIAHDGSYPAGVPSGEFQLGTWYWEISKTGGSYSSYNVTLDATGTSTTGTVSMAHTGSGAMPTSGTNPSYTTTGLTSR